MNTIHSKPKLVFFQYKYDEHLPEFLLMQKREHVKCLSEFFEVTVINENCDYRRICDMHHPDLTLFESGLNLLTCQRPEITNIHACPTIPKLGFFNADAWCETRSGTLSEMDHLGIETFFAISTTAAEHLPQIAENLFIWPNFIDPELYRDYGQPKLIPVLLAGATGPQYPWRRRVFRLISERYPSLTCPHSGYLARPRAGQTMYGEQYARTINASLIAPACGTVAKEVVRKHFEIPGSKACLIAEESPGLRAAGFIDMTNCVFADEHDVLDKLAYLFEHPEELRAIIDAGYQLVHSRHALKHRDQILQWFALSKTVTATQKIVQPHPFAPLTVVEASSGAGNSHVESNGVHLQLLREGDERLWAGKYQEAEELYLKCLSYMRRLPEARFRVALCNLYKGSARKANDWIFELIQYTVAEYKAPDPDPVEWAYYIISLLCLGRADEASKRACEFPALLHPELDRTRWVVNILRHGGTDAPVIQDRKGRHRCSIHQLPSRSDTEWLEQLCRMLIAGGQCHVAEALRAHSSQKGVATQQSEVGSSAKRRVSSTGEGDKCESWDKGQRLPLRNKEVLGPFERHLLYYKFRRKLRNITARVLQRSEAMLGRYCPLSLWGLTNDHFARAIYDIARQEDIRAVLIIGATFGRDTTEALLAGALENKNRPSVFCISDVQQQFISLRKAPSHQAIAKWSRVSSSGSPENVPAELEKTVRRIKEDNRVDFFDVVLIDGSEIHHQLATSNTARREMQAAGCVVLDDTNKAPNFYNHDGLLGDPRFVLVDHNPGLRDGYAIFRKIGLLARERGNALLPSLMSRE